jgi:serine hydrolase
MTEFIILPGLGGSGATHWQTLWEEEYKNMRRFRPMSWDRPQLDDWIAALDRAIDAAHEPPILVAHSLACLLVAHWNTRSSRKVTGAFLVAVPDPEGPVFPSEAAEFANVLPGGFDFPSLVIASSNDSYGRLEYCKERAEAWGSGFVDIGPEGHVNGQSAIGDWQAGLALLSAFSAGCRMPMRM